MNSHFGVVVSVPAKFVVLWFQGKFGNDALDAGFSILNDKFDRCEWIKLDRIFELVNWYFSAVMDFEETFLYFISRI